MRGAAIYLTQIGAKKCNQGIEQIWRWGISRAGEVNSQPIRVRIRMKMTSTQLCFSAWLLLTLVAVNQAQGIPVTYTYVGSTYTSTNAPNEPGFTLSDFVFATITLDSDTWGTEVNHPPGSFGLINSGPWQVGTDAFHVTTDLAGTIIAWTLSGAIAGLDISTQSNLDGSGYDNIFGDRPTQGREQYAASVIYAGGSRIAGGSWTMMSVPDESSSLLLFCLALIPTLCVLRARTRRTAARIS